MPALNSRDKSRAIFEASVERIPGGVNSPVRSFPGLDMTPLIAVRGEGAYVWDADDHRYIDYCGSWGPLILGHSHPDVVKAAVKQMSQGSTFGMATPYEQELAALVCKHLPSIEKIRFVSSGTEATMSALRVARGATGKSVIIKFIGHFHGHSDSLLVRAGSGTLHMNSTATSKGVPDDFVKHTLCLPFNDIATCREVICSRDDIAAVILEPIAGNMGLTLSHPDFLAMLREETAKKGIVLIFDEVISGFRVGLQGAQGYYGITPDMTCLGKIIGGGFPAAAFGGRADLMNHLAPLGEVYQGGTLSGCPVAMCAGITTIQHLEAPGFYEALEKKTARLVDVLRQKVTPNVTHLGSLFTPFLSMPKYAHFFKHMFANNIYVVPSPYEANFVSAAHSEADIDATIDAINRL